MFVRAKVDKRRETPCLMINDVIPVEVAIEKLTTSIGVKVNGGIDLSRLKEIAKKHAGKKEWFVQVQTEDGRKVSLKVNGELGVRVCKELVEDFEMVAGNGNVQLGGEGQRRMRRIEQQRLFKEAPVVAEETPLEVPSDELEMELATDA